MALLKARQGRFFNARGVGITVMGRIGLSSEDRMDTWEFIAMGQSGSQRMKIVKRKH